MSIHKLKRYDDPVLDRQIEEICSELRRLRAGLPTYADNTAAVAGGLSAGQNYWTPAGVLEEVT